MSRSFASEITESAAAAPLIAEALRIIHEPGSTFEVRALGVPDRTFKGHAESLFATYDEIDSVARIIARMDASRRPRGIYVTLNPINPQLIARSSGDFANCSAAADTDIIRRRWLLVDCDPQRPADTSSSEEQLSAAAERAGEVHEFLQANGWGEAVVCLSGNGRHLLYRVDLPNDEPSTALVKGCLRALAHKFDDEVVKIDASVFNASRIVRLYGTIARKGNDVPGYPHRRAALLVNPESPPVSREALEAIAAMAPANGHAPAGHQNGFTPSPDVNGLAPINPDRIRKYMAKVPPAVAGEHGHDATFAAAMALVNDWGLDVSDAWPFMLEYNGSCQPEWPEDELRRKLEQAVGKRDNRFGRLRRQQEHRSRSVARTVAAGQSRQTEACESKIPAALQGPISNALVEEGENGKPVTTPLRMVDILSSVTERTKNWPRRVGEDLFVHLPPDPICWIRSTDALMGFLGSTTGQPPQFIRGDRFHTGAHVFHELRRTSTSYSAVENLPHEPPMPGHYYACDQFEPGDGRTLETLLDFFNPAFPVDRKLMKLLMATIFWGGRSGARPAFVFTADSGRGVGKTTAAELVGRLAGGIIALEATEDASQTKQRLLSAEGMSRRYALLDNVKSHRFSWAEFESMITAPVISGKRMYVGEGSRPNNLIYVVTLNGVSLSKDLAQRSVIIKLNRPTHSGTWKEEVENFIADNHRSLICDCIGFLRRPRTQLLKYSRWASWERDVLERVEDPGDVQTAILERQEVADVDSEEFGILTDYFASRLAALHYDLRQDVIFIPSKIAGDWYCRATNERASVTSVSRRLKQAIGEGMLPAMSECKRNDWGRGFLWWGSETTPSSQMHGDIEARLSREERL